MARAKITATNKVIDEMTTNELVELFGMEDGPREDFSHLSDQELDNIIASERQKIKEAALSAA